MPSGRVHDKGDFQWPRQREKVPARLPSGPCRLGNEGVLSSFWSLEGTKGEAAPLLPVDPRAPATSPTPSKPPAAAPHSACPKAGDIKAKSNRREVNSAPSLLIGGSQVHGAGLSFAPFSLGGARGGVCRGANGPGGRPEAATLSWRLRQCRPPSAGTFPTPKRLLFYPSGVAALSRLHSAVPGKNGVRSWGKTSSEFGAGRHVAFQP